MTSVFFLLFTVFFVLGCAQDSGQLQARQFVGKPHSEAENLCAAAESDGSEFLNGIVSGRTLKPRNIFSERVVMILTKGKAGEGPNASLCTGVLITNDVILTAAHCVSLDTSEMKVVFTNNIACRAGRVSPETRVFEVLKVAVHESFMQEKIEQQPLDLAILQIKGVRPSTYQPQKIGLTSPVRPQDQLVQVGYGVSQFSKGGEGRLRIHGKRGKQVVRAHQSSPYFLVEQGEGGVCSGDSGGPLFRVTDKGLELLGLATSVAYTSESEDPCLGGGVYLEINSVLTWIQKTIESFRSSLGAK